MQVEIKRKKNSFSNKVIPVTKHQNALGLP